MTAAEWKKRITRDVKAAGTYQKYFGSVIDTLSAQIILQNALDRLKML